MLFFFSDVRAEENVTDSLSPDAESNCKQADTK